MVADTNCDITGFIRFNFNFWSGKQSACAVHLFNFLEMVKNNYYVTLLSIIGSMLILFIFLKSNYIIYVALAIIFISFIIPEAGQYIAGAFIFLMKSLGKINMYLFTSLFFYLFLFPIAMIFKITSKKMSLRKNNKIIRRSYFIDRDKLFGVKDFENPW